MYGILIACKELHCPRPPGANQSRRQNSIHRFSSRHPLSSSSLVLSLLISISGGLWWKTKPGSRQLCASSQETARITLLQLRRSLTQHNWFSLDTLILRCCCCCYVVVVVEDIFWRKASSEAGLRQDLWQLRRSLWRNRLSSAAAHYSFSLALNTPLTHSVTFIF